MEEEIYKASEPSLEEEKSLPEGDPPPQLEAKNTSLPPAELPDESTWTVKSIAIAIAVILGVLILSIGAVAAATGKFPKKSTASPPPKTHTGFEDMLPKASPTAAPASEPDFSTPSPTPKPTKSPKPTSSPSPKPSVTPSPSPSPTPMPLQATISFPKENDTINYETGKNLCLTDSVTQGSSAGLERKHKINDGNWTEYTPHFNLCFDPINGTNRVQVQYRNSQKQESSVYTRQFVFNRIADITISLSGTLFGDVNCNGSRDESENTISVATTITIQKTTDNTSWGTVTSGSTGTFTFEKNIPGNQTITIKPIPTAPTGYQLNPSFTNPSITFSSSSKTNTVALPLVPTESAGNCSQ